MTLSRLELTNFRTYKKFTEQTGPFVLIVGPNGTGKTNLIEAIYFLAVLKSYRATVDTETIRFGEDFAKIAGRIEQGTAGRGPAKPKYELEVVIGKGEKRAKRNGLRLPLTRVIGTLKAVLFSPEQLEVIAGPPRRRRRFMDSLLSQTDPLYTQDLLSYQKALQNRNALLWAIKQGSASASELYFWDKELIDLGKKINQKRRELADFLNGHLSSIYRFVSLSQETLIITPDFQEPTHDLFQQRLAEDIEAAATTTGPHRDNFKLFLDKRDLALFGSRGEWRSTLFALKAAEVDFMHQKTGEEPVLLLDDVFSELDSFRRRRLLSNLRVGQTILTTTDPFVPGQGALKAQIIEVEKYAGHSA